MSQPQSMSIEAAMKCRHKARLRHSSESLRRRQQNTLTLDNVQVMNAAGSVVDSIPVDVTDSLQDSYAKQARFAKHGLSSKAKCRFVFFHDEEFGLDDHDQRTCSPRIRRYVGPVSDSDPDSEDEQVFENFRECSQASAHGSQSREVSSREPPTSIASCCRLSL
eukprot:TRINITY_DN74657_c0_g1_i1.p1 TRINITY_DN74657_c0_g1~~TRINITY_DN74657_c0_g1_i1.p1  ORF type:complete len:164 (+),score=10.73 TRINITY_DN74657_c0_g1_i1:92-583(+)